MTIVGAPATSGGVLLAADVTAAAQLACLLEASAPKPGNVSPGRHFADLRYEDFLASAAAIGGPLAGAGTRPVGATVRLAVEATACWTRSNTNLGIVLLLAPLARAALLESPVDEPPSAGSGEKDAPSWTLLRGALRRVLEATGVNDARDVYAAIRRAAPGGLGRADAQDVADEPTMTLLEVMRLAADRDGIARLDQDGGTWTVELSLAGSAARCLAGHTDQEREGHTEGTLAPSLSAPLTHHERTRAPRRESD